MTNFKNKYAKVYLDNILNHIPGSVYLKDIHGVYLGCNQMQADMAGFESPNDIIGKTDYQLPWKEIATSLREVDQRIMKTGVSEELIETPILADGTKMIMLTNKAPLYDEEGRTIGIIGTSLDITDRINAEQREKKALEEVTAADVQRKAEEEAKRAVMVLAGSIAHDLRTPLLSLSSIVYKLNVALGLLSQYYEIAKKSGVTLGKELNQREVDIVENINEVPREIEALRFEMNSFIDANLKALKQSTSNSLREEDLIECKSYKGLSNAIEAYPFKPGKKELIYWDKSYYFSFLGNPVLFLRILFNLLNNSLYQIHKNGRGKIFISSEEQPDFNIIRFKDTAGGASSDVVARIFEGYNTTKEEGTGVGLAFCKLTMQSFGGDIKCYSVEGDFIEFTLMFPKIDNSYEKYNPL